HVFVDRCGLPVAGVVQVHEGDRMGRRRIDVPTRGGDGADPLEQVLALGRAGDGIDEDVRIVQRQVVGARPRHRLDARLDVHFL
nr:hypothetical protein [Tanacetum cinerariifolium]